MASHSGTYLAAAPDGSLLLSSVPSGSMWYGCGCRSIVIVMSLTDWASQVARDKLESLPSRWAHVQGVARQARTLRAIAGKDADLLEAAAILHDVGYAPDLAVTGFHPVDGALHLAEIGAPERLVNLVAHHSYALLEAELRGLSGEMTRFHDEQGPIRDALWFCDQTTSPFGEVVLHGERIAEIQERYGPGHLVTRFITDAAPELCAAVKRTERRLAMVAPSQPRSGVGRSSRP